MTGWSELLGISGEESSNIDFRRNVMNWHWKGILSWKGTQGLAGNGMGLQSQRTIFSLPLFSLSNQNRKSWDWQPATVTKLHPLTGLGPGGPWRGWSWRGDGLSQPPWGQAGSSGLPGKFHPSIFKDVKPPFFLWGLLSGPDQGRLFSILGDCCNLNDCWDFPGGTVVKNLPANAGDMGSSPGPVRSHMPRSN